MKFLYHSFNKVENLFYKMQVQKILTQENRKKLEEDTWFQDLSCAIQKYAAQTKRVITRETVYIFLFDDWFYRNYYSFSAYFKDIIEDKMCYYITDVTNIVFDKMKSEANLQSAANMYF